MSSHTIRKDSSALKCLTPPDNLNMAPWGIVKGVIKVMLAGETYCIAI